MSSYGDSVVDGLIRELAHEDEALTQADKALRQARVDFEVASEKYAAVRDVVTRHLGHVPLPKDAAPRGHIFPSGGSYRFIHMAIGDAAVAVLRESDEPLALHEIANAVMAGGLRVPAMLRAVNAALMNAKGVEKMEEGGYRYVEPEEEEEELPFE